MAPDLLKSVKTNCEWPPSAEGGGIFFGGGGFLAKKDLFILSHFLAEVSVCDRPQGGLEVGDWFSKLACWCLKVESAAMACAGPPRPAAGGGAGGGGGGPAGARGVDAAGGAGQHPGEAGLSPGCLTNWPTNASCINLMVL